MESELPRRCHICNGRTFAVIEDSCPTAVRCVECKEVHYARFIEDGEALVERVARAMQAVSRPDVDPDELTPGARGSAGLMPVWRLYEHMAKAAIAAILGGETPNA